MTDAVEIRHYVDRSGKDIFDEWSSGLADRRAQAKVAVRIDRLAAGNFGDCKSIRGGVYELRIDWGPGYRVYCGMVGRLCVLLLCGDKRKQSADIALAIEYLKDYNARTPKSEKENERISRRSDDPSPSKRS
jgi:putative addiction module killer protein